MAASWLPAAADPPDFPTMLQGAWQGRSQVGHADISMLQSIATMAQALGGMHGGLHALFGGHLGARGWPMFGGGMPSTPWDVNTL